MERRRFLKNTVITSAGMAVMPVLGKAAWLDPADPAVAALSVEDSFLQPGDQYRPWVFYMWMNGNITKNGITLDLEAMKRMGIGGFINFNSAVGIPRGPVDYAAEDWVDAVVHTAKEAERLGIDMFIHNSPGYSGCGGPWVTPEMSMQQLVWTEALVKNGQEIAIYLSKPFAKHSYYKDAFVVAYPSLPVEQQSMTALVNRISANGKVIEKDILLDGSPETKIRIEPAPHKPATLVYEFTAPFQCRSVSITRKAEIPKDLFDGPRDHPPLFHLECSDDGINYKQVCDIAMPALREMDTPGVQNFESVTAKYFRLVTDDPTWISGMELHQGPRLGGWPGKTNYTGGNSNGETPSLDPALLIDPASVLDITAYMAADGKLNWKAPVKGNWTVLRIGHTTTGEENAAHPDAGKGLEIDKLDKRALDFHFDKFIDPLLARLKPYKGKSLKGFTVDSWEAGKQNWTVRLPEEFKARRGYELIRWMPALTGRIVGSTEETERFLWDMRRTHADLLAENFYGYFQKNCHKRGLQFNAEPYGDGTFDSLQSAQYLDTPMSEFWTRYIYGSDVTSKQAAAASHIYGSKVAAAEAFTAMPMTSKWTDYPYSLKAEGDYFFTLGINRLVFHTFVHQPFTTGYPGMTMGPFGTHFDRNNTWTEQAYGWTDYLKRAQYLLQQGLFVADACYFKGDDAASGVPDTYAFMPAGYVADVTGPDALDRFTIKDGLITLPDGMSYRVCIMAKLAVIQPRTLEKLSNLVAAGMILIVTGKPEYTPGRQYKVQELNDTLAILYGGADGRKQKEHNRGKGRLIWEQDFAAVFRSLGIQPDFTYTAKNQDAAIHYIHKKLDGMDYYFISNHRRRHESINCSFRIDGWQPEIWDAQTGELYMAALFDFADGRTILPLDLEPAGSLFIVFRRKTEKTGYTVVLKDEQEIISTKPFPAPVNNPYSGVKDNFTISVWVKPDTFAHSGRSMLFHAPEGEVVYGTGHAAVGLSAGQNGLRIYERTKGTAKEVLTVSRPIEGWTHIVVVYKSGNPAVYINQKLSNAKAGSGKIVHPGLLTPAGESQFSSYFEGNYSGLKLFPGVLSQSHISQLYTMGLPAPEDPRAITIRQHANGNTEVLIRKNGQYKISGKKGRLLLDVKDCKSDILKGAWELELPQTGKQAIKIQLMELRSLHQQNDFDVKHFSGTAVYRKTLTIQEGDLKPGKRLWLELGRVEVIAEIRLNGKAVTELWKAPFSTDITAYVKAGKNQLEISVTTLWANRLIGDEYLPEEHEYSMHGFIKKLPAWYVNNEVKPGKRVAFSVWKNLNRTDPLLESGLLGPVKITVAVKKVMY